jgi:hypothetical protein
MDNRNTFFNKPKPQLGQIVTREETRDVSEVVTHDVTIEKAFVAVENEREVVPPPPVSSVPRAEPIAPAFSFGKMLSGLMGNATILQLVLLGAVFFMGNQFGSGCQKQKQIRQQINALEKMHTATLHKADSLYEAALRHDSAATQKIGTLYGQLEKLNVKDNALKVEIAQGQQKAHAETQAISNKIQAFRTEVAKRPTNKNAFGFDDEDE